MNDEDRKILMEYLGGCWHKIDSSKHNCCICGLCFVLKSQLLNHIENDNENRLCTFTTEADMMDLYKRLHEAGKWDEFENQMFMRWDSVRRELHGRSQGPSFNDIRPRSMGDYTSWLFCLYGGSYEDRCQMVADWLKRR